MYVSTLNSVEGPVGLVQFVDAPFGSVIVQLTAPVGAVALTTPVTVVVKMELPPSVGCGDWDRVIVGVCLSIVNVIGVLVTVL